MNLLVHPLTPDRWDDLEAVFQARGCSVARHCWCMYYRQSGAPPVLLPGQSRSGQQRAALKALCMQEIAPGLIAYADGVPAGWISLGPRENFSKLQQSPIMKPLDALPVWSVICFVVPSAFRRQGVATALLSGAIAYAQQHGVRLLESYPVDLAVAPDAESLWFGTKTMYEQAGFEEVARRKPARPVLRLVLKK